ncbi:MAG: hypothetical protein NVS2B3_17120 [Vulcanimicrobiaceae bacterium]
MLTFVILATLTVSLTTATVGPAPPAHKNRLVVAPRAASERRFEPHLRSAELYAARARRRYASYIRLRLLELREAGLARAAAVVERRLSVDTLVPPLRR